MTIRFVVSVLKCSQVLFSYHTAILITLLGKVNYVSHAFHPPPFKLSSHILGVKIKVVPQHILYIT